MTRGRTPVAVARPVHPVARRSPAGTFAIDPRGPVDPLALVSAVCGFTAIIPIFSQVAGIGLGIASLGRIRRSRRRGRPLRGLGWAVVGLLTSSVSLAGWIALFVLLAWVGRTLGGVSQALP